MERRAVVAILAAGILLWPRPAAAKLFGLHHVELVGPAIEGELVVDPEGFGRIRRQRSPAAVALARFHGYRPKADEPPSGGLGSRFQLTYVEEFFIGERHLERFHVLLYPYADAGPVTFTPPGQSWSFQDDTNRIPAGWQSFPRRLIANLRAAGLPSREAALAAARAVRGMDDSGHRSTPAVFVVVAAVGLAAFVLGRARLRHEGRAALQR